MKRMICLALALIMLFGVVSTAVPVYAASSEDAVRVGSGTADAVEDPVMEIPLDGNAIQVQSASGDEAVEWMRDLEDGESYTKMKASQELIDVIKDFEGFSATAYADKTQWTIGYGSYAGDIDDPKPSTRLTPKEAEALLIKQLATYENEVNAYCKKIGKQPNQNQFDALVDLTYNVGGSWMSGEAVTSVLEDACTELELVRGFGSYSRSGGSVSYVHCNRRVREALMFLYGEYYRAYGDQDCDTNIPVVSNDDLPHFKVVIFKTNSGKLFTGRTDYASYYAEDEYYMEFIDATRSGYTLTGWKISKISNDDEDVDEFAIGDRMSIYDKAQYNLQLTAMWTKGDVKVEPDPIPDDLLPEEPDEPEEPETPEEPSVETVPNETPFTDISANQWFYEAVKYVYDNGLMKGINETTFGPGGTMSRGMLVTVLYRMAGSPEVTDDQRGVFEDVSTQYYADPIAWAYANGIANGIDADTFDPNRDVTRQEAVTIFYRYYVKWLGKDAAVSGDLSGFVDGDQVASFAVEAMSWAVEAGVVTGSSASDGMYLLPSGSLNRAEGATLLMRLDKLN